MTEFEGGNSRPRLLESVDDQTKERIRRFLPVDEDVLIRVFADLDLAGQYTTRWVVVTGQRILVVDQADGVVDVPVADVTAVRAEAMVGGGRLEVDRREAPTLLVPYTSSMAVKFSEVARGLEQLRKKETFLINPKLDRLRCEKCHRLLPEKDGICPACVRR